MTLKVHHLNNSRSQRILWLLEEIGAPYEVKFYDRDATTNLAPPELIAVHPLGKSPVISDGDRVIIESGAITEYLCERHGGGHLVPERGSDDHISHLEWLHFAEGSAMTPILLRPIEGGRYRLVAGLHRLEAFRIMDRPAIPAHSSGSAGHSWAPRSAARCAG